MESPTSVLPAWQFAAETTKSGCRSTEFSFDMYSCGPGRLLCTGLHRHAVIINQGEPLAISYSSSYQWKTFIAGPDTTVCFIPAGSQFEMRWTQSFKFTAFTFDTGFVRKVLSQEAPNLQPRWDLGDGFLGVISKKVQGVAHGRYFSEHVYLESLAVACLDQILIKYQPHINDVQRKGRLSPEQLLQVVTFGHDCLQVDIGLDELANLVHLSPYHFGRLFKQTVGLSPYQFLLQLRIEYAKKLIIEKSGPLGDIAYQLNFSDQAHFSNAFRKATGVSPRQYMQSHIAA